MDDPWGLWRAFVAAADRDLIAKAVVEAALEDQHRADVVAALRAEYPHELLPGGSKELLALTSAAMTRAAGTSPTELLYAEEVADVLRRYAGEHP